MAQFAKLYGNGGVCAVDRRTSLCIFRKVGRRVRVSRVESSGRERVRSVTRVKGCIVVTSRGKKGRKKKKKKKKCPFEKPDRRMNYL